MITAYNLGHFILSVLTKVDLQFGEVALMG